MNVKPLQSITTVWTPSCGSSTEQASAMGSAGVSFWLETRTVKKPKVTLQEQYWNTIPRLLYNLRACSRDECRNFSKNNNFGQSNVKTLVSCDWTLWYWGVLRMQVKRRKQLLLTTSLDCHVNSWRPRCLRESKRAMGTRRTVVTILGKAGNKRQTESRILLTYCLVTSCLLLEVLICVVLQLGLRKKRR